jgi:hypothetical protein
LGSKEECGEEGREKEVMTNLQLYIAVCLPTLAVIASLVISLIQISGIREDMRELRREVNAKIDLLTGKVYEMMGKP